MCETDRAALADEERAERALAGIEAFADAWIAQTDIHKAIKAAGDCAQGPFKDRLASCIYGLVSQAYVEAFYAGFNYHKDGAAALRQDAGAAMRQAPTTPVTTITPERRALYEQVQTLVAGHSVLTVISALSDSLASSVAFAAEDIEAAEQLLDDLVPDMKSDMRENWNYIQELRASPNAAGGRA